MPRFAANPPVLYTEAPFLDRCATATRNSFDAAEYLFPHENTPNKIASRPTPNGLTPTPFNLPPGEHEHLLNWIDALGYTGFVGCTYRPKADTSEGLGWLRRHRAARQVAA